MLIRLFVLLIGSVAVGAAHADLKTKLEAAMASDTRSEAEVARDGNRKPLETLTFFGLKEDMHVLELLPGGGWYTKLLAPVLADEGKLSVAVGTQRVAKLVEDGVLAGVDVVDVDMSTFARAEGARRFDVPGLTIDVDDVDLALTFRNLHNLTESGREVMNRAVFKALNKGGLYGVVDHTRRMLEELQRLQFPRRHMQADNNENWRRMDPVLMIKEIEAVGFEFVDFSDLHYRYDDELVYEVGRRSVSGNTDRFTLLFKKP